MAKKQQPKRKGVADIQKLFEGLSKTEREERRLNWLRDKFGKKHINNQEQKENDNENNGKS